MTDKKGTFPPIALGVVGAAMTIGGAVLMFTIAEPFTIAKAVNPLLVFVSGMTLSSIAIVISKKLKAKHEVTNGKQN